MSLRKDNSYVLLGIAALIVALKFGFILLVSVVSPLSLGGGSDADFYHMYAMGLDTIAPNIWPILLRGLNSLGLYSREGVAILLGFFSFLVIPLIFSLLPNNGASLNTRIFLFIFISSYPTIFYLSLDIYRDVFMVFLSLISFWLLFTSYSIRSVWTSLFFKILFMLIAIFLFYFRPYLGGAILVAYALSITIHAIKYRPSIVLVVIFCLFSLSIFNLVGFFDLLLQYRSSFQSAEQGTLLNISLDGKFLFIVGFFESFFVQVFGFYFNGVFPVLTFILESSFFMLSFFYIMKNRYFICSRSYFLFIVFCVYTSIWVIANDNFGTGVRLRMMSYVTIYLCASMVYLNKNKWCDE